MHPARIECEHEHIAMFGQLVQKLQIHRRHSGNAENEITLGQLITAQRFQQLFPQSNTVQRALPAIVEVTPQFGLPDFIFAQTEQPTLLPSVYPLGTIHEVLVEYVCKLASKLIICRFAAAQIVLQHIPHIFKFCRIPECFTAEQIQQPPAHDFGGKRAEFRNTGNQFFHQLPRQAGGQAERQIRRHAQISGEAGVEVAAHPLTLHNNLFGL